MPVRLARINANGTIHDNDSGFLGSADEEGTFNWSKTKTLEVGGFSYDWLESETVDGEVKFKMVLRLEVDQKSVIGVSGRLELWEGPNWNLGASQIIDYIKVDPGRTINLYEGKLEDNEGDWVDVKLELQNDSDVGVSINGLSSTNSTGSSSSSGTSGKSKTQEEKRELAEARRAYIEYKVHGHRIP